MGADVLTYKGTALSPKLVVPASTTLTRVVTHNRPQRHLYAGKSPSSNHMRNPTSTPPLGGAHRTAPWCPDNPVVSRDPPTRCPDAINSLVRHVYVRRRSENGEAGPCGVSAWPGFYFQIKRQRTILAPIRTDPPGEPDQLTPWDPRYRAQRDECLG